MNVVNLEIHGENCMRENMWSNGCDWRLVSCKNVDACVLMIMRKCKAVQTKGSIQGVCVVRSPE